MKAIISSIALTAAVCCGASAAVAQDAPGVAVVVDGTPVTFDQPPIVREGRVFVPLRGVFERLGASVVYEGGQIAATSGRHTISLQLGSTNAVVDGRPTLLDVPPFLVGARTLVPLRFISQALGATVDYDAARQTVYVTERRGFAPPPVAAMPPPAPGPVALQLLREEPYLNADIRRLRPEISSTFGVPVDPDSVRIALDGRDVTPGAYISDRSFAFTPAFDLPAGPHVVAVRGRLAGGRRFEGSWQFATVVAAADDNSITDLGPPNGTHVGDHFDVRGVTRPGSHVRVTATTNATLDRFSDEVSQGTQVVDVIAGEGGGFTASFDMRDRDAVVVDVQVRSTAPDGSIAVRTLRLRP